MASPLDIPESYMKVWSDFDDRVEDYPEKSQADVYMFPQSWGDTTCGHGGIGGQAITQAQTIVFDTNSSGWYVYQGGAFSYHIEAPNNQFFDDLRGWSLVGEVDYEGQYESDY